MYHFNQSYDLKLEKTASGCAPHPASPGHCYAAGYGGIGGFSKLLLHHAPSIHPSCKWGPGLGWRWTGPLAVLRLWGFTQTTQNVVALAVHLHMYTCTCSCDQLCLAPGVCLAQGHNSFKWRQAVPNSVTSRVVHYQKCLPSFFIYMYMYISSCTSEQAEPNKTLPSWLVYKAATPSWKNWVVTTLQSSSWP